MRCNHPMKSLQFLGVAAFLGLEASDGFVIQRDPAGESCGLPSAGDGSGSEQRQVCADGIKAKSMTK